MTLKLVNLNIWLGGKLFPAALEFLRKENPDILTLQEVFNGTDPTLPRNQRTLQVLQLELGYPFAAFSACFRDTSPDVNQIRGNAVLSRFPIKETSEVFFDLPFGNYSDTQENFPILPRTLQHAVVEVGKEEVNLFNTQGIWGTDGNDNPRRLKMSEKIVENVKNKKNVILTGDFNVNEGTKSIENIEKELINIFKGERKTSFNLRQKTASGFASAVVDMVFVSPKIKVLARECPDVDISDHLPQVCSLEI